MPNIDRIEPKVALMLTSAKVTPSFRENLFDAAGRCGMSINEFVLTATGEKLVRSGRVIPGVFRPGDITEPADVMVGLHP